MRKRKQGPLQQPTKKDIIEKIIEKEMEQ